MENALQDFFLFFICEAAIGWKLHDGNLEPFPQSIYMIYGNETRPNRKVPNLDLRFINSYENK